MFLHKHHESLLLNDYLIFIPPENENELKNIFFKFQMIVENRSQENLNWADLDISVIMT